MYTTGTSISASFPVIKCFRGAQCLVAKSLIILQKWKENMEVSHRVRVAFVHLKTVPRVPFAVRKSGCLVGK